MKHAHSISAIRPKNLPSYLFFVLSVLLLFLSVSCAGKSAVKPPERFDSEKTFIQANDLLEKKSYEEARALFLEVKNRDLTKKFAPLAQLKIADSYVKGEESELAIPEYQKFLDSYPENQYASYAQYQIAMVYFDQIEGPERGYSGAAKALEEFEKLKRLYPRNPYKEDIELKIQKCKNIIAEYEFLVGDFYYKKGSYAAAVGRFEIVLKKYPGYKGEAMVLFLTGKAYEKLKQNDKASEYFSRLVEKYPNDKLVKDAKQELTIIKK
jgi:outer membrane protein assembly factor BamD